ncbi:unnamed protein product, partial [marine sediment metagenome]
ASLILLAHTKELGRRTTVTAKRGAWLHAQLVPGSAGFPDEAFSVPPALL